MYYDSIFVALSLTPWIHLNYGNYRFDKSTFLEFLISLTRHYAISPELRLTFNVSN